MSKELKLEVETFGNGAVFEPIQGREAVKDWTELAYLIGEANGCPRVTKNLQKQSAREYFEKHVAVNVMWHTLVNHLFAHQPELFLSLVNSEEAVPDDEQYDLECVPETYSVGKVRRGLAMDSAYLAVKSLLKCQKEFGDDEVLRVISNMANITEGWFEFSNKLIDGT
jgi:hypothetical protein